MADRAAGLGSVLRSKHYTERLVRKMQDGTLGQRDDTVDDPMDVRVGDDVHVHVPDSRRQPSELNRALVTALAMLATGAGGAVATYYATRPQPAQPPSAASTPDTDTRYTLELSQGDQ